MPILSTLGGIGCMYKRRRGGRKRLKPRGLGYFTCQTNIKSKKMRNRHMAINRFTEKHKINRLHFAPTISKRLKRRKKVSPIILKRKGKKSKRSFISVWHKKYVKGLKRGEFGKAMSRLHGLAAFKGDSCAHRFNRSRVGHKRKIHYVKRGKSFLNIGNFLGLGGTILKKKRKSLGRKLARRARVSKGKCKKVGRRRVCRTKRGKGFIRRDKITRFHSSSGRFNGIGSIGLGNFGSSAIRSWQHPGRMGKKSRGGRRRRGYSLRGFGLGEISVPAGFKNIMPPINKDFLIKSATIVSGALIPLTASRMRFIPAKWQVGWRGLLVYTLVGGAFLGIGQKVEFIRKRHAELATGFGVGFVLQIIQNYILKKTLIPAQNVKAVPALSGLDACPSCINAEGCADVGDCIGYSDGVGDYLTIDDEDIGELYEDIVEGLEGLDYDDGELDGLDDFDDE